MKIPDQITAFFAEHITEKNRYYFIGGVLFVISLMAILFQFKILMSLNPKIASLSKELKQAQENISRLGQFEQEADRLNSARHDMDARILSKEQIPAILENIAVIAKDFKIKINQLVPLRESQDSVLKMDEGQYFSFPILVHARGSYHDIGRFFDRLEKDAILMNIVDFDVTANNENAAQHSLNMIIQVFLKEKKM